MTKLNVQVWGTKSFHETHDMLRNSGRVTVRSLSSANNVIRHYYFDDPIMCTESCLRCLNIIYERFLFFLEAVFPTEYSAFTL